MCYTKDVSRNSFLINIVTCIVLYKTKNKTNMILALFFGFVGLMQLFDWIFWSNQDLLNSKEARINFATTKIAMIINHLQPIVLAGLIYFFNGSLKSSSKFIVGLYTIFSIIYTINVYHQIDYTMAKTINVYDNKRAQTLYWQWNDKIGSSFVYGIYLLCVSILTYENLSFPINIIFALINIITFGVSGYYFKGNTIGRFWCAISSYLPLLILLLDVHG